MELILWRHADAEDGVPDEERRLTSKGEKQAQRIAAWLKERLPKDAVVLASTARRARETAQALTRKYETSFDIGTSATPQSVLKAAGCAIPGVVRPMGSCWADRPSAPARRRDSATRIVCIGR